MRSAVLLVLLAGLVATSGEPAAEDTTGTKAETQLRTKAETQLRTELLDGYHKDSLPALKTNLTLGSMDIQYLELHEETNHLDMYGWIHMHWHDPRLTWTPEEHDNIHLLSVAPDLLWVPDLTIYNGADPTRALLTKSKDYRLLVYPDGKVLTVPYLLLQFMCVLDTTYWPNDEQNCSLKIGSWVHSANTMDLVLEDGPKDERPREVKWSGLNLTTSEWDIVSARSVKEVKKYPCCEEELYTNYLMILYLRRVAPAYDWMVKTPAVCLTLLTVVMFLLPASRAGVKVTFGGILLLFDLLFLTFASSTIAHNPSHTPLIVKLVVVEVVVVTVGVIVSGLVARLAHSPHSGPLPDLVRAPTLLLGRLLCLQGSVKRASGMTSTPVKPDEVELGSNSSGVDVGEKGGSSGQWLLLADIIDRLALFVTVVVTVVVLITFGCVL